MMNFATTFDVATRLVNEHCTQLTVNVVNLELQKRDKSQMTSIRAQQICDFVSRLSNEGLLANCFQSENKTTLRISSNDKDPGAVIVGPVIEKRSKKKLKSTFLETYWRFYAVCEDASKERSIESETIRIRNVHAVTSAEIQFQLMCNTVGQPAIIDEASDKVATFVLYNLARIVQLLESANFDEKLNADFSLLQEEEEWELVFVFLSRYKHLLSELVSTTDVKVGRLVQFLTGLSQVFSRYYNRVHIIKDIPHLMPTQLARLKLIFFVKKVIEHGLSLMNVPCLGRM